MRVLIYFLIIDFFFGLNGRQIMFGDESIRTVLYYSSVIAICIKGFYHLGLRLREHKKQGLSFFQAFWKEVQVFQTVDFLFAVFLLIHLIWILVLPYFQIPENPNALNYAYQRGHCIIYLAIYFPSVYLIRIGKVEWKKYRNFFITCSIIIAVVHLVLFVGETMYRETDPEVHLLKYIQLKWNEFIGGRSDPSEVFMPIYSVRIIQNFNVYSPMAFYFIVGRKEKR